MLQHLQTSARPPHEVKPELHIPSALSQVILTAMEKSREKRFQTAEEFVAALDQVTVGGVSAVTVGAAAPGPTMQAAPGQPTAGAAVATPAELTLPGSTASTPVSSLPSGVIVQSSVSPDPAMINSAAQHVFMPPSGLNAKLLLRVVIVLLAAALVGGAGYLKFQSARRTRIKNDVMQILKNAPSPTLRGADLRVWVSNDRDVMLDGAVRGIEDSALAEWLSGSVPGVSHVHNRLMVMPAVATVTSESLVNKGIAFLDTGDYASAIDCFRQASADPNNKAAKQLLDQAQRAQQTEEELLKNRR
jgi:hypothetical protein